MKWNRDLKQKEKTENTAVRKKKLKLRKWKRKNLEIRVEQAERSKWIQVLDGINEPVLAEDRGGGVRSLDHETGSRVVGMDDSDAGRILLLISDRNCLKGKENH